MPKNIEREAMNATPIIRPLHPDDTAGIHEIVSDSRVARELTFLPKSELIDTKKWLDNPRPDSHRLVTVVDGVVVGLATLTRPPNKRLLHTGQLTVVVHPDFWERGIKPSLIGTILDLADKWLNLIRIEANVLSDDERAIQLLAKFNFIREGTRRKVLYGDGRWLDQHLMTRIRMPENIEGARPIEASVVVHNEPIARPKIDNLLVRPVQQNDIAALYGIFRRPEVARTTLQLPSQEIGKTEDRVNNPPPGLRRFVAVVDENPVAIASIKQRQEPRLSHSAGLGMMVHPAYWGAGIGSRLMENILELADNWLNLLRVDLEVNTDNEAGVRLYKKFGFEVEGTKRFHAFGDGRWADSYFMARLR